MSWISRRYRCLLWVGPLVLAPWLFSALSDDNPQGTISQFIVWGIFWGTMFGQTTLAAAWSAFGPAPLIIRLPFSLVWVLMHPVALALHLYLNGGPVAFAIPIGACLFGKWLLLQFPLWGLVFGMGLSLRHNDDLIQPNQEHLQFTIRQLIAITAIVGVMLGVGRLLLPILARNQGDYVFWGLLCAADAVLTLPLVLAALLRRFTIPGVLLTLVLISTATFWEVPLLKSLESTTSVSPNVLVAMNVGAALVMLPVLWAVRLNGYSLATTRSAPKA